MSKKFLKQDILELRKRTRNIYLNKYYNMFMHEFKWTGLEYEQQDYLMRKFWANGKIAAFKVKHTDEIGFADFVQQKINMYDFPEEVLLVNKWNVPVIPNNVQVVNKDVVLGYIQSNRKGINEMVSYYIDRMVQVDMVINTNLSMQKLPRLVGISPSDVGKANDVVDRILNDELVIFLDADEIQMVNQVVSEAPYLVDKLYQYKTSIENELLMYLGLDCNNTTNNQQQLVDQVNANNQVINANKEALLSNLEKFADKIKEVLGITITVEAAQQPVESVYDNKMQPEMEGNSNDNQ